MGLCCVFVTGIGGIDDIKLDVPISTSISDLKHEIQVHIPQNVQSRISISTAGGLNINNFKDVNELYNTSTVSLTDSDAKFINLRLSACLCGGKGGFGELLKQRAKKIDKNNKNKKSGSKDLYKTLDGRRVKNIKKLKQLETYIDTLDDEEKQKLQEKRQRLEKVLNADLEKNVKFEDMEFLDDVEKQIEDIRNVVQYEYKDESDSEDSDLTSDSDSELEGEKAKAPKTPKFANFFDEGSSSKDLKST